MHIYRVQSDAWQAAEARARDKKAADAKAEQRAGNHARLLAFFEEHNPDKVDEVDSILDRYAGQEAKLFDSLATQAARKAEAKLLKQVEALPPDVLVLKPELIAFFEQHDVTKIGTVDALLARGGGKKLVASLARRYGALPPTVSHSDARRRALVDFFLRHDPGAVDTVEDMLIENTVEGIAEDLQLKFGAVPEGWSTILKGKRTASPAENAPSEDEGEEGDGGREEDKLQQGTADEAMALDGKGSKAGGDEDLQRMQSLVSGGAAVPHAVKDGGGVTTGTKDDGSSADASDGRVTKATLVAFYTKHDPSKLPSVDKILAHYPTTQLCESLSKRYGEAPAITGAGGGASFGATAEGAASDSGSSDKAKPGEGGASGLSTSSSAPKSEVDGGKAASDRLIVTKPQLIAFYSKHDPSKVDSVDKILKHYTTSQLVSKLKER